MKNRFIIWALLLCGLFRKKRQSSEIKRYLVVSTTALGDTIWATPAIRSLKQSFPDSSIDVFTSYIGSEVLTANPNIDEIFVLPKKFSKLCSVFRRMDRKKYDVALIFHTSQRLVLPFCFLLGIPEIIGIQGDQKGLDSLLSKKIEKKTIHEVQKRLEIISACGVIAEPHPLEIFFDERHVESALNFLKNAGVDFNLPLIAIHPGAKDRFKQWHPDSFIELGKKLKKNLSCNLLITGGKTEKDLVQRISGQIPGSIPIFGDLSLKAFAALIQKLDLLIIGDTGPMHIAFSQNTKTIALFCATDPNLCGSHLSKTNIEIFSTKPTCTPCLKKKCSQPFCLLQISSDMVLNSALRLFKI